MKGAESSRYLSFFVGFLLVLMWADAGYSTTLSGSPAAISGDYAVVRMSSNKSQVYHISGDHWLEHAELRPTEGTSETGFGDSVAISGDWVAIGAPADDAFGEAAGAVYFFQRVGSQWIQRSKLSGTAGEALGTTVVIDGDRAAAVVQANDQCSVKIFRLQNFSWIHQETLTAPDSLRYLFAQSYSQRIDLEGNTLVVGAPARTNLPYDQRKGAAYIYEETSGQWRLVQKLENPDTDVDDSFGISVAISNQRVAIGRAKFASDTSNRGVYLFIRDADSWRYQAKVSPPEGYYPQNFGSAIAMDGDRLLVSSPSFIGFGMVPGAVFLYRFSDDQWQFSTSFQGGSSYGSSYGDLVSLSGNWAAVSDQGDTRLYKIGTTPQPPEPEPEIADQVVYVDFPEYQVTDLSEVFPAVPGGVIAYRAESDGNTTVRLDGTKLMLSSVPGFTGLSGVIVARDDTAGGTQTAFDVAVLPKDRMLPLNNHDFEQFGRSVSIRGNSVLIGAPGNDALGDEAGAAYLFAFDGDKWIQEAMLTAEDGAAGDHFGQIVSLSDTHAVVSAPERINGDNRGAVYVFVKETDGWHPQARLVSSVMDAATGFGGAAAISGDWLMIGESLADGGRGAVNFYRNEELEWVPTGRLSPKDDSIWRFGATLAVADDRLIVGSLHHWDHPESTGSASVYEFRNGEWMLAAVLWAATGDPGDGYGAALGISGDHAVVGAPNDDSPAGAVYHYRRDAAEWRLESKFSGPSGSGFGDAVALCHDTLLVAADHVRDDYGLATRQRVLTYRWMNDRWVLHQETAGGIKKDWENAGEPLSCDAGRGVVGLPNDNLFRTEGGGCAVVDLSASGPFVVNPIPTQHRPTGSGTVEIADLNSVFQGGATENLIFTTESGENLTVRTDGTILKLRPASGFIGTEWVTVSATSGSGTTRYSFDVVVALENKIVPEQITDSGGFGASISMQGDRAVVGALYQGAGAAYILVQDGDGWRIQSRLSVPELNEGDWFGHAVSIFGNTAVIGAPGDDEGAMNAGAAYVFEYNGTVWENTAKLVLPVPAENDGFGSAVALNRDFMLVGAPWRQIDGVSDAGAVFIFSKESGRWVLQNRLANEPAHEAEGFGGSVAITDSYAVVGTSGNHGVAYVFIRSGDDWDGPETLFDRGDMGSGPHGIQVQAFEERVIVGFSGEGDVMVFRKEGSAWMEESVFVPGELNTMLVGRCVALTDGHLVVGSSGKAFVFDYLNGVWGYRESLQAPDGSGDAFGTSVAAFGNRFMVGSSGSVYHYVFGDDAPIIAAAVPKQMLRFNDDFLAVADLSDIFRTAGGEEPMYQAESAFGIETILDGTLLKIRPGAGFSGFSTVRVSATRGDAAVATSFDVFVLPEHMLVADDWDAAVGFGGSVAISGDFAVVGSPGNDSGVQGAAYVFQKQASGWRQFAKLVSPFDGDYGFGRGVAISGNRCLVTGFWHAAVFELSDDAWVLKAGLTPPREDSFYLSANVFVSGDCAMIGTSDTAYLYTDKEGEWFLTHVFDDADSPFRTIQSFSMSDQYVALGVEDWWRANSAKEAQCVHLYRREIDTWQLEAILEQETEEIERFGAQVLIFGDQVAITAPEADTGKGRCYFFTKTENGWQRSRLNFNREFPFGYVSMAFSDDRHFWMAGNWLRQGALFAYDGVEWLLKAQPLQRIANDDAYGALAVGASRETAVFGVRQPQWSVLSEVFPPNGVYFLDLMDLPDESPVASAGPDQIVKSGASVMLDGSGSVPADNVMTQIADYTWTQLSGPAVALSGGCSEESADPCAQAVFIAPQVGAAGAEMIFHLIVTDGRSLQSSDTVRIFVEYQPSPPTADPGGARTITEGRMVLLDASNSSSADGSALTYQWRQLSGPPVTLSNPNAVSTGFVPPPTGENGATLVFELTVTDGTGRESRSEVSVTVTDNGIAGFDDDVITFYSVYGQPLGIRVSENAALVGLEAIDPPETLPPGIDEMPFGLVAFGVKRQNYNEPVEVVVFHAEPLPASCGFYAYSAESGWHEIAIYSDPTGTRVSFTISESDSAVTVIANGDMMLMGGAGCPEMSADGHGGGGGGCFIETLHGR